MNLLVLAVFPVIMLNYPDDSNSWRKGFFWLVDVEKACEQDLGEAGHIAPTVWNQRGVNDCDSTAFLLPMQSHNQVYGMVLGSSLNPIKQPL